ncbi:MAG TPA: hypothetical protein DCZ94_12645 [Lentisphaeria bacterium]|nr:MAG: hypothetical protein A2X48_21335 [Lentisphaerae bacterium GWF2_49_21]HBC87795.1 hypothetical protein [Lentisphaeria bacterium]
MNLLVALTLSALISISGWLNEGLKALERKDYDAAIASLSKITKENSAGTKFYEMALFYKAQAYQGKGDKDKALAELTALLKGECGKDLRVDAKKLFVELGGKPEKLFPEESPKKVWEKYKEFVAQGEGKKALEITTGELKSSILKFAGNEGSFEPFAKELVKGDVGIEKIPDDPEEGEATLEINNVAGRFVFKMRFVLDKEFNRWLISSYKPDFEKMHAVEDNGPLIRLFGVQPVNAQSARVEKKRDTTSNISKLKQIGLGCRMYSQEHKENFPANFDELITGGYLENKDMYVWISPEDGSKDKFIYCPGLTENSSVDFMAAAAPRPANGKRDVLYTDGHAATITEEEFQKTAKEQGWKAPAVARFAKKDIPEEKQKLIRELVAKIADPKAEVRQDAKKKLREMGAEAYPILEEFTNHADPEIKLEVRNILKGK